MTQSDPTSLGGIIHTYQKYDPAEFPNPSTAAPDMVSPAFEHMLMYGEMGQFSDEDLANAVKLDISQIAGLGPSLESLKKKLLEFAMTWGKPILKRKLKNTPNALSCWKRLLSRVIDLNGW